MQFSRSLTAHLDSLTEALDGSGDDLHSILTVLVDDLHAGITSFVGLSITVSAGGEPITVTAMNARTAATSMLLPLAATPGGGGHIVLYAENPGTFADLAADARTVLGPGGEIVMDGHLPAPTRFAEQRSVDALADRSSINQAFGFLIGQGYPPARAKSELARRATAAGVSLPLIAAQILNNGYRPDPEAAKEPAGADGEDADEQAG